MMGKCCPSGGYEAVDGWDPASGLGSLKLDRLGKYLVNGSNWPPTQPKKWWNCFQPEPFTLPAPIKADGGGYILVPDRVETWPDILSILAVFSPVAVLSWIIWIKLLKTESRRFFLQPAERIQCHDVGGDIDATSDASFAREASHEKNDIYSNYGACQENP